MKKIFIDSRFFSYGSKESAGLISALKNLSNGGYSLFTSNARTIGKDLQKILSVEVIDIKESGKDVDYEKCFVMHGKGSERDLVINAKSKIKNIEEAVSLVLKKNRTAEHKRTTKETAIKIEVNLDGTGKAKIKTGIGFFDHMLEQIARHGNIDLAIITKGDLHVDEHHTVEDTGIALGEAIKKALGEKTGIKRYGFFLPMDDSIARCSIDLGGRNYLNFNCKFEREKVGEFPTELTAEFFKGLSMGLGANIYLKATGKNDHHKIEAMFKAFAKSLNEALRIDERAKGKLPTTKGLI
ncbi:MAG: imidazoleglycerol-phosphate dehydratase HisB [Ignavibacteriales bacterium]|nr:imidazoleglycerol-phosphate dehydratase HisB [Ignavibacteriales bacterium]